MSRIALVALIPLMWAASAGAQPMDPNMPGMAMPSTKPASAKPGPKPKPKVAVTKKAPAVHPAGHDMSSMPGMTMPEAAKPNPPKGHDMSAMPGMAMPAAGSKPAAHDMGSMPGMTMAPTTPGASKDAMPGMAEGPPPVAEPPAPAPVAPTDHAAERDYDPAAMAAARTQLRLEHGGGTYSKVMANLAEYQARAGGDGYRWEGEAWYGGDLNRLVVKSEGEGSRRGGVDAAEVQALYSRAVGPYFNLQAGVRQDFRPTPKRTYATVGIEGLAPYWFEVQSAIFLSNKGEVLARAEGTYDLRLTQRLILQPRAELNFAAQDTRETGIGAGLSNAELGLRLRYEIRRDFAPYIGISFDRQFGRTAKYSRAAGEDPSRTSFVVGVRAWF